MKKVPDQVQLAGVSRNRNRMAGRLRASTPSGRAVTRPGSDVRTWSHKSV